MNPSSTFRSSEDLDRTIDLDIQARAISNSSSRYRTPPCSGTVGESFRLTHARAAPTYWIVNLVDRQLEVFTAPDSAGYQARQILGPADRARVVIDGVEVGSINVADMLP